MAFTDDIEPLAEQVFSEILSHPMVEQLGEGTLDEEPFRRWVRQDYVYLVEYGRLFALAAGRAPDLDRLGRFAELLAATVNDEMDLHRRYAAEFGIDEAELAATVPSPTTRAYTDFLVRTAAVDGFGETVAALLPCMWGFRETGVRLAERGRPDHEQYAAWVDTYASDEFGELTDWCLSLMDDVADGADDRRRERYRERFLTSARYEYRFWDAAWRGETWTVATD